MGEGGKHKLDSRYNLHYNVDVHQRSHFFQGEDVNWTIQINYEILDAYHSTM